MSRTSAAVERLAQDLSAARAAERKLDYLPGEVLVKFRQFADAGCTYLQLDDVSFSYLCDPKIQETARRNGDDPAQLGDYAWFLVNRRRFDEAIDEMKVAIDLDRGQASAALHRLAPVHRLA